MKYFLAFVVALFSLLAAAAPAPAPAPAAREIQAAPEDLEARQFFATTQNELETGTGPCPPVIFIFARGSTEPGNMGMLLGPLLASALKSRLGQSGVWVQGVGGPYGATLVDNVSPAGSSQAAIREMRRLFIKASTKCPNARILAAGYSQGSALTAAAISGLDESTRAKIAGTVLFGYTKNLQSHGQIPNYPSDRLKVYCNPGDMVCTGSLFITAAHLGYGSAASRDAPEFLISRLKKTELVT
ncbi:hypothetical protein EsDP_00004591 [Epichloe bromicola]|uniref:cutinase n=1 Tax=Epichloe bromicola TaxID=79588 RepID=A0ABQ0CS54_9HYPO